MKNDKHIYSIRTAARIVAFSRFIDLDYIRIYMYIYVAHTCTARCACTHHAILYMCCTHIHAHTHVRVCAHAHADDFRAIYFQHFAGLTYDRSKANIY